jgi:colanic acid/amylovoran biosynthesis glycosyltransferase
LKIACFLPRFPVVSQNFILGQLTGLIDRGCEIDIFAHSPGDPSNAHPDVARYGLLERTHYWAPTRSRARRLARYLRQIAARAWSEPRPWLRTLDPRLGRGALGLTLMYAAAPQLRRDHYDIFHCHFGNAGETPALLRDCLGLRAGLVTTFYGHDVGRYPRMRGRDCYARLFSRGDLFLALSASMQDRLVELGCPEAKLGLHHLGVDGDAITFRPRSIQLGETVRVACSARMVPKKGLEYAIRALAKLRERKLDVELHLVGDGPERRSLEALIGDLELHDRVKLYGEISQPQSVRVMERCHLFVQPSVTGSDGDEEGTPTAILEAMASGMPVVATCHSGISEQVEDGVSGFLVPERDVQRLTERLAELVLRPDLWPLLGRRGRHRVEADFDRGKQSSALLDHYRRVLDQKRMGPNR